MARIPALDEGIKAKAKALMDVVGDGDLVVTAGAGSEPIYLMRALAERAKELSRVRLAAGLILTDYDFLQVPSINYVSWFPPTPREGAAIPRDRVDYLPFCWAQAADWLLTKVDVDVLILQVSPADEQGYHSYGISSSYTAPAMDVAKRVIAEVNPQVPRTLGRRIHSSRFDGILEVDYPVLPFPSREPGEVDIEIGKHVATLVPDGSTLQVGVGSIPDSAQASIAEAGVKDLRLHSTLTRGGLHLVRGGNLAPGEKTIRIGDVLGDQEVYDWIDENPMVEMVDARDTHRVSALVQVPNFVSIGSAISIDIYGQANMEYVDGVHAGAVGGAADFTRAGMWPGNRSILALRSTTSGDRQSRIVPRIDGATVSVSREAVQYVVTEYGIADLGDKTVRERAEALREIAHPKFRDSLTL